MMLQYSVTTFPRDTGGYNLTAYTEGVLRLYVGTSVFLDAEGILLVELAIALDTWLRVFASEPVDFYYDSMDFEEEPILAFRYDAIEDRFRLESVWSDFDAGLLPREDVISGAQEYLSRLRDELRREHDVDLDQKLEEAWINA